MAAPAGPRSVRTPEERLGRNAMALELKRMRHFTKGFRGCCKGEESLVDDLHGERQEKSFAVRMRDR